MAPLERRGQEKYDALWDEIRRGRLRRGCASTASRTTSTSRPTSTIAASTGSRSSSIASIVRAQPARPRSPTRSRRRSTWASGVMHVAHVDDGQDEPKWQVDRFSQHLACDSCGRSFEPLNPHHFSFNSPLGWCPVCEGLGVQQGADPAALIRDGRKSLRDGAVAAWPDFADNPMFARMIEAMAAALGFDLDTPFDDLEGRHRRAILHGTGEAWFTVPAADGQPEFSFQYKGLFPAIDEAGAGLVPLPDASSRRWSTRSPASPAWAARLRDDAAAVPVPRRSRSASSADWPLGADAGVLQGR